MTQPPDIHLDAGLVQPALDALETQRRDVDFAWLTAIRAVRAGESGFNGSPYDVLFVAFRPGYQPKSDEVHQRAERRFGQYGQLVAAGRDSVAVYARGDGDSALSFPEPE